MDEPWKHGAKWEKPDQIKHMLHNSIYMKNPEKANPQKQKVAYCSTVLWGGVGE